MTTKSYKLLIGCAIILLLYIIYTYFNLEIQTNLSSLESYENNSIIKTTEQIVTSTSTNNPMVNPEKKIESNNYLNKLQSFWKYLLKNGNKFPLKQKPRLIYDIKNIQNNPISEQSSNIIDKPNSNLPLRVINKNNQENVEDIERRVTEIKDQISDFLNAISEDIGNDIVAENNNTQNPISSENSEIVQQNLIVNNEDSAQPSENTESGPSFSLGDHELWYEIVTNYPNLNEDEQIELLYNAVCEANDREKGIGSSREFPTIKPSAFSIKNHKYSSKSAEI